MKSIVFSQPAYLWALFFLLAIILIHLLKRPRIVKLEFSTLRFFSKDTMRSKSVRKIRNLIQLLIRCLIAAIIVLLFAKPHKSSSPLLSLTEPHSSIYVWVDQSVSMEYTTDAISISQKAYSIIDSLKRCIPASSQVYLFDHGKKYFEAAGPAIPIEYKYGPSDFESLFSQMENRKKDSDNCVLLLFSDFQEPLSTKLDSIYSRLSPDYSIVCVTMSPASPWNYSVAEPELRNDNGDVVSVKIQASGKPLKNGELQAIVDKLCIGKQRVDVVAGNKYDASISARRNTSITQGKVVLQESDPLSFDNTVSFISGSRASMRILIIGDKKVNFTIVAALQASGNGLHNKIILKDEKELTYDELDSADIIFINGLRGPSTVLESFAANRATTDKAIVFCIEQSEEFLNINQRLVSKAFTNGSKIRNLEPQTPVVPILADTISELWRGFPKTRCDDVTVYRYSTGAPGNSVLKLSNGHALITDTLDNANRTWIIITTSIGITDDNNLYESGFYVPFIDRITRYARSSIRSSSQVWMAGYLAKNPLSDSRNIASVFDEDGKLIKTLQNQPYILFEKPGNFKVVPQGDPSFMINVQYDTMESILKYKDPVLPAGLRGKMAVVDQNHFIESISRSSYGWLYLPWIVLILLFITEVFLWEKQKSRGANKK